MSAPKLCPTCGRWPSLRRGVTTSGETTERCPDRSHDLADAALDLADLVNAVTLEAMGGCPDLFGPDGGWDAWWDAARPLLDLRREAESLREADRG